MRSGALGRPSTAALAPHGTCMTSIRPSRAALFQVGRTWSTCGPTCSSQWSSSGGSTDVNGFASFPKHGPTSCPKVAPHICPKRLHGTAVTSSSLYMEVSAPQPAGTGLLDEAPAGKSELQMFIDSIPFRKLFIWGVVGLLAYELSDFFGIVMGTFIISFIGNSFVDSTEHSPLLQFLQPPHRRRVLVLVYFSVILATLTLFGVMTIPDIASEGADFVNRLQSDNIWVVLVEKMRAGLGDHIMDSLEKAIYLATSNDITAAAADMQSWTAERSMQLGVKVSSMLKGYTTYAAKVTGGLISSVTRFALQSIVTLVLGFMLVWDMPSITRGVHTLKSSRLSPIYNEVAPVLAVFGKLFGKTLEAQARIALVNTALTAFGMWVLAIPGIGLLSLFVFVCSFIPIAGCIISTVPIGFVALTEYGFFKLGLVIFMVTLVHFVEAYALNPAIYSAHLKLHPLMVLSVLVVAEHSLGIWGLLLAVPMTVFALDYCIRWPKGSVREVAQKELAKVLNSHDDDDEEPRMNESIPVPSA